MKEENPRPKLTYRQQAFVDEYLICRNASAAARAAGYAQPHSQGPRLLENVEIREEITNRTKARAMDADEVLDRLAEMGRASISEFLIQREIQIGPKPEKASPEKAPKEDQPDDGGDKEQPQEESLNQPVTYTVIDLNWEAIQRRGHLIKKVSYGRHGPTIELHDPQAALIHLGKNLGLFKEKHEVTGPNGGPIQVEDVAKVEEIRAKRWEGVAERLLSIMSRERGSSDDSPPSEGSDA